MLQAALEETRNQEVARLHWIESERERLAHEERIARERADFTRGSLERVHRDALEKLERVFEEKERFELKIAIKPATATPDESAEELEELCRLAREVPSLWHHPAVTYQERKEILRCLIDHIVVSATHERIDARIIWKTGDQTSLALWRGAARNNLIRELHAEGLAVSEIQKRLAAGRTSTGQIMNITTNAIYERVHKLGLKPSRYSAGYLSLREKAAELNREGRSLDWIAQHFNEEGLLSIGKPWAGSLVSGSFEPSARKPNRLRAFTLGPSKTPVRAGSTMNKWPLSLMKKRYDGRRVVERLGQPTLLRTGGILSNSASVSENRMSWPRESDPRRSS